MKHVVMTSSTLCLEPPGRVPDTSLLPPPFAQVKAAEENRRRKHAELELDLRARQAELDRLKITLDSLRQVSERAVTVAGSGK